MLDPTGASSHEATSLGGLCHRVTLIKTGICCRAQRSLDTRHLMLGLVPDCVSHCISGCAISNCGFFG